MLPRYPIYIPSKGRANQQMTSGHLSDMRVPHYVIVEDQELPQYEATRTSHATLLVLDPTYRDRHETLDDFGYDRSFGAGPARNFAWDHAIAGGFARHWDVDDNIAGFWRLNMNRKTPVADGTILRVMEDFTDRYENIGISGPQYYMFAPRKTKVPPFTLNTRIYSCSLIRNDLPLRWRLRMNEDTDLSLRVLKSGLCTVLFNAFLQWKSTTQTVKGGYMSEFYGKEGTDAHLIENNPKLQALAGSKTSRGETLWKSQMLVDAHPDVARIAWRFGRWHHYVDYSGFRQRLQLKDGVEIPEGTDNFGMELQYCVAGEWTSVGQPPPNAFSEEVPW